MLSCNISNPETDFITFSPKDFISSCLSQKLFRGCAGEEVRGGKAGLGMKEQVRGNWISMRASLLHTTMHSHAKLTVAHAKDAQALAKDISSADRPLSATCFSHFLSPSLSLTNYYVPLVLQISGALLCFCAQKLEVDNTPLGSSVPLYVLA